MSLLAWLPLAATTLFSEKVPTLSEPRMIQIPAGSSLMTMADTAAVASKGYLREYYRTPGGISILRELKSSRFGKDLSNISKDGVFGSMDSLWHFTWWTNWIQSELTSPIDPGSGYHTRHVFNSGHQGYWAGSNISTHRGNIIVCSEKAIHWFSSQIDDFGSYTLTRSFQVPGEGHPLCHVAGLADLVPTEANPPKTAIRAWRARAILQWPLNNGYWAVKTDSADMPDPSNAYDSIKVNRFDWMLVSDTSGHWMSFDQSQAKLFWRVGEIGSPFRVDSLIIPGLTTEKRPCYQVTKSDSLVTFAVDSQIVFVKWTPNEVRVLAKYAIPGKVIQAAAAYPYSIQGTSIWATTGTELYSFKFSMEEPPVASAIPQPRNSALFALQHDPHGASFTWYGSGTEIVRMTGIDGRAHGTLELRPGATTNWTAPRPGLYLAHTPDGVKRVLAR